MPELPEVETIKRQLQKTAIGKKIKVVEIKLPKLVYFDSNPRTQRAEPRLGKSLAGLRFVRQSQSSWTKREQSSYDGKKGDAKNFKKHTEGARILEINRAAKILIIALSNGYTLLVHLKMTGQLIYRASVPNKWTHIIFHFTDGSKLYFNDLRQFGYMKLVRTDKLKEQKEIQKLGPEPLDKNFSFELFSAMLKKRAKAKIKPLLLDQNFISGIGNIYADESLHYAGVRPTRPAGELKQEEVKKLYDGIKKILKKSITKGGTSVDTYVTLSGKKGGYEKYLRVYGREGKPCFRCKTPIKRVKLGSRSTHFCPKCQV